MCEQPCANGTAHFSRPAVLIPACRRKSIRREIRILRRSLSNEQQQQAAQKFSDRALCFAPLQQARRVALFLSVDGELDTRPLIARLLSAGKTVCLPVLHPFSAGQLLFFRYDPDTPLVKNQFGIQEPRLDIRELITLNQLDIMFVPLVAFDKQGQRLGMGGGFYDRTLQHWQQHNFLPIGAAHDCQQVATLPIASWDIALPAIITPNALWQWE